MNSLKRLLKLFYVMIPRIVRQQFLDDPLFILKEIIKQVINKDYLSKSRSNESKKKQVSINKKYRRFRM